MCVGAPSHVVDQCAAATCCLTEKTAPLNQSHVGQQHRFGSEDELISGFVIMSLRLSLPLALSLIPWCFTEEGGGGVDDLYRLK